MGGITMSLLTIVARATDATKIKVGAGTFSIGDYTSAGASGTAC